MSSPASFSCICTKACSQELGSFLLTLSLHHPGARVYVMCDSYCYEKVNSMTPRLRLDIWFHVALNKYTDLNRQKMEQMGLAKEFWLHKCEIIDYALQFSSDTLLFGVDVFLLGPITCIDKSKQIGLSPHYIDKAATDQFGFFNADVLWTQDKTLTSRWRFHTPKSRFYDQAAIEELAKEFSYFSFEDNHNVSWWRMNSREHYKETNFSIKENKILYNKKPLVFVQTHFDHGNYDYFNSKIINLLKQIKDHKSLMIIDRILNNGSWILQLPAQPSIYGGIWNHADDSFRELIRLCEHNDLVIETSNIKHPRLKGNSNVVLYDRPTFQWFESECENSFKCLIGNDDVILTYHKNGVKQASPWIFWPRRPSLLEKKLQLLSYQERNIESVFIGNYENSVQQKFRQPVEDEWNSVITEFHNTAGHVHKFTQDEYLDKLRHSKFGLCLRGYGSKCHREVECAAFGTVLLVTPEVNVTSYHEPLQENVHFIRLNHVTDYHDKVKTMSQEKWEYMSNECRKWFMRNVHSSQCWQKTLEILLYND